MEVKSPIIKFVLQKCDVQLMKNYSDDFYGPMRSNDSKSDFVNPLSFAFTLIGLILVLCTNCHFDKEKVWNQLFFLLKSPALKEFCYVLSCLCASLIFLPFTLLIGVTFKIYREYVRYHLLKDKSLKFVDFMTGEDTVWVCENDKSKSIINVLAFVKSKSSEVNENLPRELLQSIRARIFTKLVLIKRFPKLFYRKQRDESGYFYWTSDNTLSINNYVRYLEKFNDSKIMSDDEMKRQMSEICNNALPGNNSALWECLISQQPIQIGDDIKYPVSCYETFQF
jgi:hypothetical protein